MAPALLDDKTIQRRFVGSWRYNISVEQFNLEAWSQGFMVGALIFMSGVTLANMGRRLLHKLILLELLLAVLHGTFCFMTFDGYGWYVSGTAVLLYCSWILHDIIAWMKNKAFFSRWLNRFYIGTLILVTPYWILESYANFAFVNNINTLFTKTRPLEALFRDPWWIFTCCNLVWNIKTRYDFGFINLIRICPRFGVMLLSMAVSIVFLTVDVLSTVVSMGGQVGVNPWWKLSLVFKCFCDTIILDDFRSTLDKLRAHVFETPQPLQPIAHCGREWPKFGANDVVHGLDSSPAAASRSAMHMYSGVGRHRGSRIGKKAFRTPAWDLPQTWPP
ncbi:MAG: hypothetical protein M1833_005821 [Piccolia ochrophora]|nr:MAG: hypothetical protein M1833_005821 [Piccolia ochrophora]